MKPPSSILVVDTAILIAALLGRGAGAFGEVADRVALVTTDRAVAEARRRLELGLRRPDLVDLLDALVSEIEIAPVEDLPQPLDAAERVLRNAVPIRNGTVSDAHILALAWQIDADVWTHDRDFAGTGVASWSTSNLLWALAEAPLPS